MNIGGIGFADDQDDYEYEPGSRRFGGGFQAGFHVGGELSFDGGQLPPPPDEPPPPVPDNLPPIEGEVGVEKKKKKKKHRDGERGEGEEDGERRHRKKKKKHREEGEDGERRRHRRHRREAGEAEAGVEIQAPDVNVPLPEANVDLDASGVLPTNVSSYSYQHQVEVDGGQFSHSGGHFEGDAGVSADVNVGAKGPSVSALASRFTEIANNSRPSSNSPRTMRADLGWRGANPRVQAKVEPAVDVNATSVEDYYNYRASPMEQPKLPQANVDHHMRMEVRAPEPEAVEVSSVDVGGVGGNLMVRNVDAPDVRQFQGPSFGFEASNQPDVNYEGHGGFEMPGRPPIGVRTHTNFEPRDQPEFEREQVEFEMPDAPNLDVKGSGFKIKDGYSPEIETHAEADVDVQGHGGFKMPSLPKMEVKGSKRDKGAKKKKKSHKHDIEVSDQAEFSIEGAPKVDIKGPGFKIKKGRKPEFDAQIEGQSEFQIEGQPEFQMEGQPGFHMEGQPGFHMEGQPGFQMEGQPGFHMEGQPGFQMEGQPGFQVEGQPGFQMEGQPGFQVEGQPGFQMEGQPGFQVEGQPGFQMEGQPGFRMEGQPEFQVEGKPGFQVEGQSGFQMEGQPEFQVEGQPEFQMEGQPGFQVKGKSQFEMKGKPKFQMKGKPGFQVEGQPGVQMEGQPGFQVEGQPGFQMEGRPGFQMEGQSGFQMEGQPGFQMEGQPGFQMEGQPGFQMEGQPGFQMEGQPGFQMEGQPGYNVHGGYMPGELGDGQQRYSINDNLDIHDDHVPSSMQPPELHGQVGFSGPSLKTPKKKEKGGFFGMFGKKNKKQPTHMEGHLSGPHMEGNLSGPQMEGHLSGPQMEGHLSGPQMQGNLSGPQMQGNLSGPQMQGNLSGPQMDAPSVNVGGSGGGNFGSSPFVGSPMSTMRSGGSEVHRDPWQSNPQLFNPNADTFDPHATAMASGPQVSGRAGKKGKKLPSTRPIPTNKARVILLDGEELDIPVDKKALGREIFDRVCDHQSIEERDYFGLTYVNRKEQTWFWLDMDKKISRQLKNGETWFFNFQVKFYPPEPALLQEDITRYQLSLQIRQDIYTGKLPCSWVTQALLGSLLVQSEIGDFEEEEHGHGIEYLNDFQFVHTQNEQLLNKIAELHRNHKNMNPGQADLKYLETAKRLELYGYDLHPARDLEDIDIFIGVSFTGIVVYRGHLRISRFAWPKVLRISYRKNFFYLKIRSDYYEDVEAVVGFKLFNHKLAKRLWKIAVEHHTFFRLKEPRFAQKTSTLPRFGSRHRFSGRTFYQYRTMSISRPEGNPHFDRSLTKRRTASMPMLADGGSHYGSMHSLTRQHPRDMTLGKMQSVEYLGPAQPRTPSMTRSGSVEFGSRGPGSSIGGSMQYLPDSAGNRVLLHGGTSVSARAGAPLMPRSKAGADSPQMQHFHTNAGSADGARVQYQVRTGRPGPDQASMDGSEMSAARPPPGAVRLPFASGGVSMQARKGGSSVGSAEDDLL